MSGEYFPGKAIALLDAAAAYHSINKPRKVKILPIPNPVSVYVEK